MNGKQRDDALTDVLVHQIPTFSPTADRLLSEIARLSGTPEREQLRERIAAWERTVPREVFGRWFSPPWIYLSELASGPVGALEADLRGLLERRRAEARSRGWELD
jgi:hypothetical protein